MMPYDEVLKQFGIFVKEHKLTDAEKAEQELKYNECLNECKDAISSLYKSFENKKQSEEE